MKHACLFVPVVCLALVAAPQAGEPKPSSSTPANVKAAFLKLLDRPRVNLDVRHHGTSDGKDVQQIQESFASEKKANGTIERVPVLIVRPVERKGRLPAVIVLHGTGGTKEAMLPFMKELAARGLIGVAIDARHHGARAGESKKAKAYHAAILRAWQRKSGEPPEYPVYYDTCWDLWRTVDYLQKRDDIDPDKIGMIGFSMGGIQTWLASSVDERVKVVVPAIAVQSFFWSLANDRWQARARTMGPVYETAAKDTNQPVNQNVCRAVWARLLPGIIDQFDCPSMIRLFAGRPLLILSGEKDNNCPLEGAKIAFAAAEKAYREAKASDWLHISVAPGVGHQVTAEQRRLALDWFAKWLK